MKRKLVTTVSSLVVLSTVLAACNNDSKKTDGTAKKDAKQILRITSTTEIPSMDSAKATDAMSFEVLNSTNEGLLRLGPNGTVEPGIADKPEVSSDGLKYTFHLRDAKWSNGDKVTAQDFIYAWKRALDPKIASEYAFILYYIKNGQAINEGKATPDQLGVNAPDDKTLEVTLERPTPYFLQLTTFGTYLPENQKFVESQGKNYGLEAGTVLSNGPFELSEWKHEQSYTLKKNPNYWDKDSVKLDEIRYNVVKDTSSAVNLYEGGQVDLLPKLDAEFIDKYKNDAKNFHTMLDARLVFFRFNESNPLFKNENARKAIDLAYDKKAVTDGIMNNGAIPAYWLVPTQFAKGPDGKEFRDTNGDFNKENIKEAQKLWAQAKKELGKNTFQVNMLSYDDSTRKKAAEYIAGELTKNLPGLNINVQPQPFEVKLDLEKKLNYDFSFSGWGPDYPDPMTFIDMFLSNSPFNESKYNNPEYDKLVLDAKKETDATKRWNDMLEAEKVIMKDSGIGPIYQNGIAYLEKPTVKGVYYNAFGAGYSYKNASNKK